MENKFISFNGACPDLLERVDLGTSFAFSKTDILSLNQFLLSISKNKTHIDTVSE